MLSNARSDGQVETARGLAHIRCLRLSSSAISSLSFSARRYGIDLYNEGSDLSRRFLKNRWNSLPRTLFARVKEDKPALSPLLVLHICFQLRWTWNIFALQHFELDDVD